jgi:hypothetical protein
MLNQEKSKYRERFNAKAQKTQRKSKCRFTTEDTEGTEVKLIVSECMRLNRIDSLTTLPCLSLCSL